MSKRSVPIEVAFGLDEFLTPFPKTRGCSFLDIAAAQNVCRGGTMVMLVLHCDSWESFVGGLSSPQDAGAVECLRPFVGLGYTPENEAAALASLRLALTT